MLIPKYTILGSLSAMIMGGALLGTSGAMAQPNAEQAQEGAEILTRGPVHEAFAGTISFDPEVGMIVDRQPPALIEEVPPEQRLEGDNVTWIPGYWAWDDDQNDFLWISGIWRNLPPGREWVPGYWADTEGRYQWTSGYWEDEETTEVSYLPEPPRSLETGPNIEAASNDQTWVPGNWVYREDRYAWRAGYWVGARENWSWTPAYYRWTRRGYVYVDGYWDYPVASRGVVFAPVRFQPAYIARPDFYYSPLTVISLAVFTDHLFLRPSHSHYYFGDYYEPRYRDRGYFASYSYNGGRRGYDPIYAHSRWENRNDRNWDRQRQEYFEYRRDHQDARPPRTWAALSARPQSDRDRGDYAVADRFDRVASRRDGRQRFQAVDKNDRERFVSQRQEIRKFGREREELETRGGKTPELADRSDARSAKVKVGRSPVASKKSARSDKDGGPPARLQPRASDKSDNAPQTDRQDPSNPKKNKEATANREGQPRPNGKAEPNGERRTQPGQKREADPTPAKKAKSEEKRQADPTPKRQADPTPKRQADPTPKRQADPTPKRQADPTPKRQADPTPKRQADPNPKRQADPTPKRQATPTPERKAQPTQKKRQAEPAPEGKKKKADNQRESAAAPVRRPDAQPKREAVAKRAEPKSQPQQAKRQVASEPQRKQASRPQPQQAPQRAEPRKQQQQAAQPQRSLPKQNKAQTASRQEAPKAQDTDRKKNKKDDQ